MQPNEQHYLIRARRIKCELCKGMVVRTSEEIKNE